eukprot:GHVS01029718.1.p1 GENE.GHVS01029718.1~~GHVS01029718.1.p1  ORF type:complete len:115 (-),score=11.42 GHVS01029718.1:277-621(-)
MPCKSCVPLPSWSYCCSSRGRRFATTISILFVIWFSVAVSFISSSSLGFYSVTWLALPLIAIASLGLYSLVHISYALANFRACPQAAADLSKELQEASEDLKRRGFIFADDKNS